MQLPGEYSAMIFRHLDCRTRSILRGWCNLRNRRIWCAATATSRKPMSRNIAANARASRRDRATASRKPRNRRCGRRNLLAGASCGSNLAHITVGIGRPAPYMIAVVAFGHFRRPDGPEKCFCCNALHRFLALDGPAMAEEYRPASSSALIFRKPRFRRSGSAPTEFARVPIEAKPTVAACAERTRNRASAKVAARKVRTVRVVEQPRAPARGKTGTGKTGATSHQSAGCTGRRSPRQPARVQARDHDRVQTWPCKSGGICNWQR